MHGTDARNWDFHADGNDHAHGATLASAVRDAVYLRVGVRVGDGGRRTVVHPHSLAVAVGVSCHEHADFDADARGDGGRAARVARVPQ